MANLLVTLYSLVALSVITYTGVDTFYRVVRWQLNKVHPQEVVVQEALDAQGPDRSPLDAFKVISERNVFGSSEKASQEAKTEDIGDLEPTSLKIALLGTVTGSEEAAFAVIEETDKRKQGLYKVGDSIQDAAVKTILRGKVILKVGDKDEILTMEESAASRNKPVEAKRSAPPAASSFRRVSTLTVDRSDIEDSLKDINKLLTEARISPHFVNGRPSGLSLSQIEEGSVFAKLGLTNGDIVKGINGRPIREPEDLVNVYRRLKSGSRVSLQLIQQGRRKTINYRFK